MGKRGSASSRRASAKQASARPASAASPIARRLAASRKAIRLKVRRDRSERLKLYRAECRSLARAQSGKQSAASGSAKRRGLGVIKLAAEGDSWFDFPPYGLPPLSTGGVITSLKRQLERISGGSVPIYNMAHAGDETRTILGVDSRARLARLLASPKDRPDALLFSGGGNDIVGDPLVLWLLENDGKLTPERALHPVRFPHLLGLVMGAYEDLRAMRNALAPKTVLFIHAYDFAVPTGKGVCGFGPWLKPALRARGWNNPEMARRVVQAMLKAFGQRLETFAAENPEGTVMVQTQGVLTPEQWHDELHPNRVGFDLIAARFAEAIQNRFAS